MDSKTRIGFVQMAIQTGSYILIPGGLLAVFVSLGFTTCRERQTRIESTAKAKAEAVERLAAKKAEETRETIRRLETEQAKRKLPSPAKPWETKEGGASFPLTGETLVDRRVWIAWFELLEEGPREYGGAGESAPVDTITFTERHYHEREGRRFYQRGLGDIVLRAGAESLIFARVVDPERAGERIYGQLTLGVDDPDKPRAIRFEPVWITIEKE